jgi:hypothetical protein
VKKNLAYLVILSIFIILIYYFSKSNVNNQSNININDEISPTVITLYQNNCASCHGLKLQGQNGWKSKLDEDGHRLAPPLNGSGHTWHHSPDYLYKIIGNDSLTDQEVWHLIDYIKKVWPIKIQDVYNKRYK